MYDNIYEKNMHFLLAEDKCIFHVAQVQSCNTCADYKQYAVEIVNKCYTFTNCTCLMHSCNYVVFEKFTCAYYHQIDFEKLLLEQDSFKVLYGLHATA